MEQGLEKVMGIKETLGVGNQHIREPNIIQEQIDVHLRNIENVNDVEVIQEQLGGLLRTGIIALQFKKGLQSTGYTSTHIATARHGISMISKNDTLRPLAPVLSSTLDGLSAINDTLRTLLIINASSGVFSDRAYNLIKKQHKKWEK